MEQRKVKTLLKAIAKKTADGFPPAFPSRSNRMETAWQIYGCIYLQSQTNLTTSFTGYEPI
jgi:hypothetical protein